jgi:hypothetical protein
MISGLSISTFTTVHVVFSLLAIFSGFIVVPGMIKAKRFEGWTAFFLLMTGATSVTGFLFPSTSFGPSQFTGVISLVTLAIAIVALYGYHLEGAWRWTYVVSAVLALYLNVFVGIVQAFQKIPFLHSLAPTQSGPPFLIAQVAALVIFIVLGRAATIGFHPDPVRFAWTR